jgi:hydrogenase 3 maturation protease
MLCPWETVQERNMVKRGGYILEILRGRRFGVIGIGNIFRGDDGAGPEVVSLLSEGFELPLVDASEVPENYGGWVVRQNLEVVVFVDAVDFGGKPGEFRAISPQRLVVSARDTHRLSIHMMIRYLEEEWGGKQILIGIQPASLKLGETLSPEVTGGVRSVADLLRKAAGEGDSRTSSNS